MDKPQILEEMKKKKLELDHYEDLLYRQILNDAFKKQSHEQF